LTTFIDHRPSPGQGKSRTNNQQWVRSIRRASNLLITPPQPGYCPESEKGDSRPSIRQKGARRSSGQDRKDQGARGGFKSANAKIQAGRSQSIEACHTPGDPTSRRPLKTFC